MRLAADRVARFLEARCGKAFCDRCLADVLAESKAEKEEATIARVAKTLAESPLFHRGRGKCARCKLTAPVTSAR